MATSTGESPVQSRDMEADKAMIDELLTFLPRNKPDVDKIKAAPEQQLRTLAQNTTAMLLDAKYAKKLADSRRQLKILHALKAIFDNTPETDKEMAEPREKFNLILTLRKESATDKSSTTTKRKAGGQKGFETEALFNPFAKVQKTFTSASDAPIPPTWIRIPNSLREPIVFIDAKDDKAAQELRTSIENAKIQLNLTAEITNLKTKGDKVIIKLTTTVQAEKFKAEMKKLFPEVTVYSPNQRDPMILLFKIPKGVKIDDLITDLKKYNAFNAEDKIIFHKSYDNPFGNTKNVILRVSPAIRQELENKRGILLYRCSTIKAVDYFGILKCSRCLQYSHLRSACASQSVCKHCAERHNSADCPDKLNSIKFKCAACNKAGHRATDLRDCEEYLRQLTHAASISSYSYSYIIQD